MSERTFRWTITEGSYYSEAKKNILLPDINAPPDSKKKDKVNNGYGMMILAHSSPKPDPTINREVG